MLKLNSALARAADEISAGIRDTGKYIGVITRAEKLTASTGTEGLGLSFKADTGQTAEYLDTYHTKDNGDALPGLKTVNAILCCTRLAEVADGPIQCEKWNNSKGVREKVTVPGYPALMGKRIGFLLQQVIESDRDGKDREKVQIFGVFNADTELTASEMYDKKTKPERLTAMLEALLARPVRDNRKGGKAKPTGRSAADDYSSMPPDDDIPF